MGNRILTLVLMGLFFIGLLVTLLRNPLSVLIPLAILGTIIYFLRKPRSPFRHSGPRGGRGFASPSYPVRTPRGEKRFSLKLKSDAPEILFQKKKSSKKKQHAFRVIEGKKGKSPSQDKTDKHLLH
ncbi:MAG: hypothetical protein BAA01_08820 [Bacillus thermozeamaize]|jgi:hypothetical protein|uniref:Uncharacterized protein n=1 Tax=Bacillus thermozeamaize TaxID=230954 RepID=A0A1Y3PMG9_9BACI|nr:MAG: hypothetical protein BAA01_08820 [Bacillus thermozeamaize]